MPREFVSTGTRWEERVGYARCVRAGDRLFVSGTLAVDESGELVGVDSVHDQAAFIYLKIERALAALGSSRRDIVLSRIYVTRMSDGDEVGLAHREFFGSLMPCATMVAVSELADPSARVEIEVEAVVGSGDGDPVEVRVDGAAGA
ncbi:MAG: Rid family hydrolase [Phycisphaerales bacterium]